MKSVYTYLTLCLCVVLIGCTSTIVPNPIHNPSPSYDGMDLNSGLIGFTTNKLMIVTEKKMYEYNLLISKYGSRLMPPITTLNYGLKPYTNNTYSLTKEALAKYFEMKAWSKEGSYGEGK